MAQQLTDPTSTCCAPETQATCCEPTDKAACCDTSAAGGSCGCSAGQAAGQLEAPDIRETVRAKYAEAARAVSEQSNVSCCGPVSTSGATGAEVFGGSLYDGAETEGATASAVQASLGCGVPTAVADLHEGETVLDLGSGAGADVLISARRVGPTGTAIGLDMTDEMLELARQNQADAGIANVQWLKGHIEAIPLPDASVDVVISNCVLNLSGDKPAVIREAARVLKPGGRFAISDVIADANARLRGRENVARAHHPSDSDVESECAEGPIGRGEAAARWHLSVLAPRSDDCMVASVV